MTETTAVASKVGRVPVPGNLLVLGAITLVSVGLCLAFYRQLGMPGWAAIGFAALIYASLLMSHVIVLRGRRIAALEGEVERLWKAMGKIPAQATAPVAGARMAGAEKPADAKEAKPAKGSLLDLKRASKAAAQPASAKPDTAKPDPLARVMAGRTAKPDATSRAQQVAASLEEETALARAMAEPEIAEPDTKDTVADERPSAPAEVAGAAPAAIPVAPAARALDPATIHQLVKKLADEAAAPAASVVNAPAAPADAPVVAAAAAPVSGDAITESVRALRATAEAMRPDAEVNKVDTDSDAEASAEITPDQDARLSAFAEALSADRIDVLLQPILGLKDQVTRHYEVSIGLRTPDGALLDPADDRSWLAGTGILPLIDLAKISRIAEVARALADRGKSGAVFTGVAAESLSDDDFLTRFSDIYNDRAAITEQLVVSLAQADVRAFAPGHWDMVKELSAVGFRFALEHVTDLDMDFDMLKSASIQYVKLDAEVYLNGLPAGHDSTVPPEDVYRFLADKGLSLIVDRIESEAQLMKIVDFGALYGQGRLFGGARPVKAKVFTARTAAA